MNRLTRDELIHRALDMVDSPNLNDKERPGGVLSQNAMALLWIQDGLDYFHRRFPMGGAITSASLTMTLSTATATIPTDFNMDVRNGVRITAPANLARRLLRTPLQTFLGLSLAPNNTTPSVPQRYTVKGTTIYYWPTPDRTYTAELWYYQMPAKMTATSIPIFPDDWSLIEFVRLRGLEWVHEAEPGAALKYAGLVVSDLQKQGLGVESENDQVPMSPEFFRPTDNQPYSPSAWLGDTVPH